MSVCFATSIKIQQYRNIFECAGDAREYRVDDHRGGFLSVSKSRVACGDGCEYRKKM